ncbi:sentrin-specific protease 7b [Gouania willdenowi]|uniref:sentrin-specific protease 7b n=1 Tax=Gouania willdenowi TaxID=441366 RepID=UPI001055876C|nr:sentrin-specific protease 7-like [Gouania willdenowi]
MNTAFKIPKRKQADDSAHLHILSPLSRLQDPAPSVKGYGDRPGRNGGGVSRLHAGSSLGSDNRRSFSDVVKSLLGIPGANHTAARGRGGASGGGVTNGWRPKRTSDRLLPPEAAAPPQRLSINSVDSLAELRAKSKPGSAEDLEQISSEDDFLSSAATGQSSSVSTVMGRGKPASSITRNNGGKRPSSSVSTATGGERQSLMLQDVKERQRAKWLEFKQKKQKKKKKKEHEQPSEPIVLSSEDEEEVRTSLIGQRGNTEENKVQTPSFLQLEFTSLHVGLMEVNANGPMTVTETGILIPVTGAEDGEVTVVTSQLRGCGLYGGGVAKAGSSLLLLWVTDAQSHVLHREIHNIRRETHPGPPCVLVLLVLKQLQDLQTGLLVSILDQYQTQNRCSSLDLTEGLLLVQSCPPPLDQHLLHLLGQSSKQTREKKPQQVLKSMIQYPKAPCKGGITVTEEDLLCLNHGEFLNDVIIDFYLKYLSVEGGGDSLKIHVFSSFFYKQLSRRLLDDDPSVPDRQLRHQRVKTWTRHVDIFDKHFLFVPVNQESHWFLVIVCFPGLEEQQYETFEAGHSKCGADTNVSQKTQKAPSCTVQGCSRDSVLKRPCILIMDSLKLTNHNNVSHLLREYLQTEWECRRNTQRLFSDLNTPCSRCIVTQQDNSSDCGVYLLQYAQSFMQNPVVHFDLPPRLDNWFPRQQVRQKRQEIRNLILSLRTDQ